LEGSGACFYPMHNMMAEWLVGKGRLTKQEERHGLYGGSRSIGRRVGWERVLTERGLELRGDRFGTVKRG